MRMAPKFRSYKEALTKGNLKRVKHLILNDGLSPGHVFENGQSALHVAVGFKQTSIAHFLLQMNVNINHRNHYGQSVLAMAVSNRDVELADYLLLRGSKPNTFDKNHQTPLHIAAQLGEPNITKSLLEYGAEVNAADKLRRRPIHLAVDFQQNSAWLGDAGGHNFTKTIIFLIAQGANIHCPDKAGRTPLWLSVLSGDGSTYISRILLSRNVNVDNGPGQCSPLSLAVRQGFQEQCKILIEFNSCLDMVVKFDGLKGSLLDRAVHDGQRGVAGLLAAAGCWCTLVDTWREVGGAYSLRCLCRREVRQLLGCNIHNKALQLPLPNALIRYVLMKDVLSDQQVSSRMNVTPIT